MRCLLIPLLLLLLLGLVCLLLLQRWRWRMLRRGRGRILTRMSLSVSMSLALSRVGLGMLRRSEAAGVGASGLTAVFCIVLPVTVLSLRVSLRVPLRVDLRGVCKVHLLELLVQRLTERLGRVLRIRPAMLLLLLLGVKGRASGYRRGVAV